MALTALTDRRALTRADLEAAIHDVQTRSVAAYLRRQTLEQQRQQLQQQTLACDQELLLLDGEQRALQALTTHAGD
jgi:hypothetical protein